MAALAAGTLVATAAVALGADAVTGADRASGAVTEQAYPVPADRTYTLTGRGFGHGVGMSQYGAKGGAEQGSSAAQILRTYYPHTALADPGNPRLRVALSPDGAGTTHTSSSSSPFFRVVGEDGLTVVDYRGSAASRSATLPTTVGGSPVTTWGVSISGSAVRLHALYGGSWHPVTLSGPAGAVGGASAGPLEFRPADGIVALRGPGGGSYSYRGYLRATPVGSSTLARVNVVTMERYLLGVVPSEMPASWASAAVQAQTVAARTYAENARRANAAKAWDICDSISCQVYRGVAGEHPMATAKIAASPAAVKGAILTYAGRPISAMFSASNGGWSIAAGTAYPYLPARADRWDFGYPWTEELRASCVESAYAPGRQLRQLVVTGRDGNGAFGGRVTGVRFDFSGGVSRTVTGTGALGKDSAIRALGRICPGDGVGLKSSLFAVEDETPPPPPVTDPQQAIGAAATASGQATLASKASDGSVWLRRWSARDGLGRISKLGGRILSSPAVRHARNGRLEVYARSAATNGLTVRTKPSESASWGRWQALGGSLRSGPSAVTAAHGRVYVFARGASGDVVYRVRSSTSATWSRWLSAGGQVAAGTGPRAVATGDGRVRVVVHGRNHALAAKTMRENGRWSGWQSLGGAVVGTPAVASDSPGRYTVVVRGPDRRLHAANVVGGRRGAFTDLGGAPTANPAAAATPSANRLDVFVRSGDSGLMHRSRTGTTWSGWRPVR